MKAMIFAAGLGTRLGTETANRPKALVEINGKTLLQIAIEKLASANVSEIIINVHHFADKIKSYIANNDFGIPVLISDETDKLLDTGGGLKKAAHLLKGNSPLLVYNVDIISNINLKKLIDYHKSTGALATLVVRNRQTNRYLKFDDKKQLTGWLNKKSGETKIVNPVTFHGSVEMAYSGIQVIDPAIFDLMPAIDRFSVIDLYLQLAKSYPIKGFFDESQMWMDVGKPESLEEARQLLRS